MKLWSRIDNDYVLKYVDLFCGIGGFRIAVEKVCQEYQVNPLCVFSSDLDSDAQQTYEVNFGDKPDGDITKIASNNIPSHNILFAGFPCQPFSICGKLEGFEDIRGTLFFEIARILKTKKPYVFILENVKQLQGHNKGKTLKIIIEILEKLGYYIHYKVLNAIDFGLPQKRERIFIVGFLEPLHFSWIDPQLKSVSLSEILETNVSSSYYASDQIRQNRLAKYEGKKYQEPTIWHENKAGHISAYPYSCALRAGASYNYLLVNGKRRLTEREMLRLQGFPDNFKIVRSYSAMRKLIGNSVAVPCVTAILHSVFKAVENHKLEHQIKAELKSFNDRFIQVPLFQVNYMDIIAAKTRLDSIIKKTRTRYYKPIQIAEVLYRSRVQQDIDVSQLEDYRTKSKKWRNEVSKYLLNQTSSSSSRFQDDIWNNNAMPPEILAVLDRENKELPGVVERYVYYKFIERQSGIIAIFEKVRQASSAPEIFNLTELLDLFRREPGLKRSIDKCYEIVTYSLFETVVTGLEAEIAIKVSQEKAELLKEFEYLAKVLLNIDTNRMQWSEPAHIYRVGVTNAADRGLDMWANFGPAIQVKHLTLDENAVREIVEGIESDHIVIVCRDIDASLIEIIIKQIGWGKRVQGIIKESDLIEWYERACRGKFAKILAPILIKLLIQSFESEFPQASNQANKITEFCQERGYTKITPTEMWQTPINI